jgi:hypothetical protein
VVPGQSIAGIRIGMTQSQVARLWGHSYVVCRGCGPLLVWLYEYPGAEPLGAAVKFSVPSATASTSSGKLAGSSKSTTSTTTTSSGKVIAVFTLGSPLGWGTKGAMMFDPVSNVYDLFGNTGDAPCIGYDALTVRIGSNTMSFYTASGVIYGFALTAPSQPACQ